MEDENALNNKINELDLMEPVAKAADALNFFKPPLC